MSEIARCRMQKKKKKNSNKKNLMCFFKGDLKNTM